VADRTNDEIRQWFDFSNEFEDIMMLDTHQILDTSNALNYQNHQEEYLHLGTPMTTLIEPLPWIEDLPLPLEPVTVSPQHNLRRSEEHDGFQESEFDKYMVEFPASTIDVTEISMVQDQPTDYITIYSVETEEISTANITVPPNISTVTSSDFITVLPELLPNTCNTELSMDMFQNQSNTGKVSPEYSTDGEYETLHSVATAPNITQYGTLHSVEATTPNIPTSTTEYINNVRAELSPNTDTTDSTEDMFQVHYSRDTASPTYSTVETYTANILSENIIRPTKTIMKAKGNKKGPKPQPLCQLPAENHRNILRCREYRVTKKTKINSEEEEMKEQEARNRELRKKMVKMQGLVEKMQNVYLKLITEGKIKFVYNV